MRLPRSLAIVAAATLISLAGITRAQNFVANGDFDSDLAGWYVPPPWIANEWAAFDADGSVASGSLRQENANDDGVKGGGTGQCVAVVAGEPYRVGFSVYVPSGQDGVGHAGLVFQWMANADCSGAAIGGGYGTDGAWAGFDAWRDWRSDFLAAPVGAHAMLVDLRCDKTSATGTFVAYWDDVFVAPEPASALAQGVAILALAAARRRARCS